MTNTWINLLTKIRTNLRINYDFCFDIGFFIILLLFLIFMFSEIGFLFKIPVNCAYILVSLFASFFYILKRKVSYDKKKLFFTVLLIFAVAFILSVIFWDSSWDGRWYHQYAIISLRDGWNPVYDNALETVIYKTMFWEKYYPKFCEIISANFVVLFKNIESGKIINWLLCFSLFSLSLCTFSKFKNLSEKKIVFISFLTCFNPVLICQISTYYIDFIVYIFFVLLIFSMYLIRKECQNNIKLLFVMSLVMLSAVKTIGLFYVPLFLIFYFLYCKGYKSIKQYSVISIVTIFLVLITMVNPYFTNVKQGHHILYPLAGENKIDILTGNRPDAVRDGSYFLRTLYGIFAVRSGYNCADSRVGGFGCLWGLIILVMFCYLLYNMPSVKLYLKNKDNFEKYLIFFILFTVLINPENWWARYVPQFWLFVIFFCASILNYQAWNENKNRFMKIFLVLILINSLIVFVINCSMTVRFKSRMSKVFGGDRREERVLYCAGNGCFEHSFFEKLKERNIKYKVVDESFYKNNQDKFSVIRSSLARNISIMEKE